MKLTWSIHVVRNSGERRQASFAERPSAVEVIAARLVAGCEMALVGVDFSSETERNGPRWRQRQAVSYEPFDFLTV